MTKVMISLPTSLLIFLAIEQMGMGRDVTAFRKRFEDYKNGKSVSEIYDAGLPRYSEGTPFSDEEAMDYILQLENPGRVGYSKGIWRPPTDSTKYDVHQIGGGLDMREEHNPIVYNYLKSKNRLNDPWLTEAEEKQLRMQTWNTKKPLMNKFVNKHKGKISQLGYDTAAAMLWHGHPFKMMNSEDSITGKALLNAIASGDQDLTSVFDAYYNYGSNAKRFASRINANTKYRKGYKQMLQPKDSEFVQDLRKQEEFKPWSNYHSPDYSLSNPAPSSISSWNNVNSPAFNTSELYSRRTNNNINNIVQDILFNDKDVQDVLMDNLSKNVFGGKRLGFKNGKLPILKHL